MLKTKVQDVDHDGHKDLVLSITAGITVTLLGVTNANAIKFAAHNGCSDHQSGVGGLLDGVGDLVDHLLGESPKLFHTGRGF